MGRRTVLLIAALVVAALGTTMVFLYVNGVNDRAIAKQSPVRVLVAKTMIEPGTSVEDANDAAAFERKTISSDAVVDGAVSATTALAGKVALTTIYPGEQIISQKFGDPGSTSTLSIPTGKLAVSVTVNDPAQTAGFVDAGTNVAIFWTGTVAKGSIRGETRLLLPKALVLAIGSKTAAPSDSASTNGTADTVPITTLTIAVDQTELQKVVQASTSGKLSLGLLGKGTTPTPLPATSEENLFN